MLRCSAIVVTYNSAAVIRACLHALGGEDCEIVVVDNASQDDTLGRVEEFVAKYPVRLIANPSNRGFGAAVNQGVAEAAGDVFLLLNPDAIAESGAVAELLKCLESNHAGAVGGALLEENGQPARGFTFRRLPTLTALVFEALLLNRIWPGNPVNRNYRCLDADYSKPQRVQQPAGACLAATREAWEAVGGFDEQFFPVWFEDVDLCERLSEKGSEIYYCPTARFHHGAAHSVGKLRFRDKQLFWYTNMLRYARKHFSPSRVTVLRIAIIAGMMFRSVAIFGTRDSSLTDTLSAYWAVIGMSCKKTPLPIATGKGR